MSEEIARPSGRRPAFVAAPLTAILTGVVFSAIVTPRAETFERPAR